MRSLDIEVSMVLETLVFKEQGPISLALPKDAPKFMDGGGFDSQHTITKGPIHLQCAHF